MIKYSPCFKSTASPLSIKRSCSKITLFIYKSNISSFWDTDFFIMFSNMLIDLLLNKILLNLVSILNCLSSNLEQLKKFWISKWKGNLSNLRIDVVCILKWLNSCIFHRTWIWRIFKRRWFKVHIIINLLINFWNKFLKTVLKIFFKSNNWCYVPFKSFY